MERMPVPEPADRPMGILGEPNPDRALLATLDNVVYARHPVRTHLVTDADDATEVVRDIVIGMSDGLTVPFALAA